MEKINIGIIGLGYWGPNLLRNLASLSEYCSVNALCDINEDIIDKLEKGRQVWSTTDYKKICNDKNINAIIIATPTKTHYEIAKFALENEKDIFCEKPLTNNIEHARDIVYLTEKNKRITMVGNIFVYNAAVKELKKRIDLNELGDIYEISCVRKGHGPIRSDVNVMWDLAPHDVSIILYLTEKLPKKVTAVGFNYLKGTNLEDSVDLTLAFDNGIGAKINISWLYPSKERKVTVVGSKKMAVFDDVNGIRPLTIYERSTKPFGDTIHGDFGIFKMQTTDGEIIMPKLETLEPMRLELEHFLNCVRKRETPLTDAKNGYEIVKILCAAQSALKNPGWIEI